MKSTKEFKSTIQSYLDTRASEDTLFAASYAKGNKNIDDCITYILNSVKKSGCNGFTDEEIYSKAVHYYDEDNIDVGNPVDLQVVVNHVVEISEEEKQEAKRKAMTSYENRVLQDIQAKAAKKAAKKVEQPQQLSLFDMMS